MGWFNHQVAINDGINYQPHLVGWFPPVGWLVGSYFFDKKLIRFDPLQDFEVPFSKHGSKTGSLSECWTKPMRLGWDDEGQM